MKNFIAKSAYSFKIQMLLHIIYLNQNDIFKLHEIYSDVKNEEKEN